MTKYFSIRNRPFPPENRQRMKIFLSRKLKKEGFLWSYDIDSDADNVPDEIIIEKTLIHLDYTDYQYLFCIYPKSQIKDVWKKNIATQGEYYYSLNYFIAWFCFGISNPKRYLKNIERTCLIESL